MSNTQDNRHYAPRTGDEFAAAARSLLANGFTVHGAAEILKANVDAVRRTLIAEDSRGAR
jgi:hypothetical protein